MDELVPIGDVGDPDTASIDALWSAELEELGSHAIEPVLDAPTMDPSELDERRVDGLDAVARVALPREAPEPWLEPEEETQGVPAVRPASRGEEYTVEFLTSELAPVQLAPPERAPTPLAPTEDEEPLLELDTSAITPLD